MCNHINSTSIKEITKPFSIKNNRLAFAILVFDILVYLILIANCIAVDSIIVKIIISFVLGIAIAFLFIIGHDCCHNSFTSNRKLNTYLGVLCFMPSLHNFKLWELGHNKTHHAFSNLKSKDYVYTPMTKAEYDRLSPFKRFEYRVYRSVIGHMLYYLIEIWCKKMIIPHKGIVNIKDAKSYNKFNYGILIYVCIIATYIYFISIFFGKAFFVELLFSMVIPFLAFNWLMGFVIYQHHTNLDTRWFENEEEWNYWESQIENSVHITFPKPLNFVLHNIMEHTAHHVNMNIPLYNLNDAQAKLETTFGTKIKTVNWSIKYYWQSIRKCKLYDYEEHRWLIF